MVEVVLAFYRGEARDDGAEVGPEVLTGAVRRPAGQRFELSKDQLNRIEVWTVGRQKPERGARLLNLLRAQRVPMHRQVVQDHDIARAESWH